MRSSSAKHRSRLGKAVRAKALRPVIGSILLVLGLLELVVPGPTAARAEVRVERLADGTILLIGDGRSASRRSSRSQSFRRRQPPAAIASLIDRHSRQQGLEPNLVQAVIQTESSYDVRALSIKGAMGLMQLMPETARDLGVSDPWDPDQNIAGGTRYLRGLLDRFGGDLERALAGYNAGPSAVERYQGVPPYAETTAYVDKVIALYRGESYRGERFVRTALPQASPSSASPTRLRTVRVERQSDGTLLLVTPD